MQEVFIEITDFFRLCPPAVWVPIIFNAQEHVHNVLRGVLTDKIRSNIALPTVYLNFRNR